jgi:hypothetical protein
VPGLGDYLGRLVSDVGAARAQADAAAARLADLYQQQAPLQNLPVPRFRFSQVDLSVPVVVTSLPAGAGGPPIRDIQNIVTATLAAKLSERGVTLSPAEWATLTQAADQAVARMTADPAAPADTGAIVDALTSGTVAALPARLGGGPLPPTAAAPTRFPGAVPEPPRPGPGPPPSPGPTPGPVLPPDVVPLAELMQEVRDQARLAAVAAGGAPGQVEVQVTASELQNANPANVIRVSISLVEEGLEWRAADDGTRRLLLE